MRSLQHGSSTANGKARNRGHVRRHNLQQLQQHPPTQSTFTLHCHCQLPLAMASALRPVLARHALQRRVLTSTLPAFRSQLLARQPALQRAPFQTTPVRPILPPLPQTIEGGVNDPVPVPDAEPSHGSYHWTAERYCHRTQSY